MTTTTTHAGSDPAYQDPTEREARHALLAALVDERGRAIPAGVLIRLLGPMSDERFGDLMGALFEGRDLVIDGTGHLRDPGARRAEAAPPEEPAPAPPPPDVDPDEIPEPEEAPGLDQPATPVTRTERTAVDPDPDDIPDEPDDA